MLFFNIYFLLIPQNSVKNQKFDETAKKPDKDDEE